MAPRVFDCSFLRHSHPVLDFGESLLDRIEIRGVWRQEPEPCACGSDGLPNGGGLVGAKIVHDDDVAGFEFGHEQLLDISAEALAVDRAIEDTRGGQPVAAQRSAPRKVRVRQCPCGAKPRRRLPRGPQPRRGAMLVLIHVSSIKTRLLGSRPACKERHRCRRRAMSARACSSAKSVFFEPKPFAAQELPHRIVRHLNAPRRQFILQAVQRQMRRLIDAFGDEGPVWLKNTLAMSTHLARSHRAQSPIALMPLYRRRNRYAEPRAWSWCSRVKPGP